jgi:hypothetical protein
MVGTPPDAFAPGRFAHPTTKGTRAEMVNPYRNNPVN